MSTRDPNYPDNLLEADVLNSLYGGAVQSAMDKDAWAFLNGWVRSIAKRILTHLRVDFDSQALLTQDSVVMGDCLAMDITRTSATGGPWIGKIQSITAGNAIFLGVALEPKVGGQRVQCATHGALSAVVTGLGATAASGLVAVDRSTSRLRAWVAGDDAVAYSDTKGNISLFGLGRVAAAV